MTFALSIAYNINVTQYLCYYFLILELFLKGALSCRCLSFSTIAKREQYLKKSHNIVYWRKKPFEFHAITSYELNVLYMMYFLKYFVPTSQEPSSETDAKFRGYLKKLSSKYSGRLYDSWTKRWFVFDKLSDTLSYYRRKSDEDKPSKSTNFQVSPRHPCAPDPCSNSRMDAIHFSVTLKKYCEIFNIYQILLPNYKYLLNKRYSKLNRPRQYATDKKKNPLLLKISRKNLFP